MLESIGPPTWALGKDNLKIIGGRHRSSHSETEHLEQRRHESELNQGKTKKYETPNVHIIGLAYQMKTTAFIS